MTRDTQVLRLLALLVLGTEILLGCFSMQRSGVSARSPAHGASLQDALLEAVFKGNNQQVTLLLRQGANVNGWGSLGVTPLGQAAEWGHFSTAALLIQHGALVNATDANGEPPLLHAIWNHHSESVLARKAQTTSQQQAYLQNAQQSLQIVQLLLDKGALVDKGDQAGITPLLLAAHFNDLPVVKMLIHHKANVNLATNKGVPLIAAIACPRNVVKTLGEPIHVEVIRTLLQAGAKVNEVGKGTSPLILAVRRGDLGAVRLLLRYGADVSFRDQRGRTALDYAKEAHRKDILYLLIHGTSVQDITR